MTPRTATKRDAQAIAAIWNEVIHSSAITFTSDPKSVDEIAQMIATKPVLVLDIGKQIAGFATYGPFRSGPGYRFVAEHSIYLTSTEHRCGHGRTLLRALERDAVQNGIDIFIAGIGGENTGAQAFHRNMGYVQVAQLPDIGEKFGRRHDLILMQKILVNPA